MKITFVVSDYCPKNVTKKGLNKLVDDLLKYLDNKVPIVLELGEVEVDRHQWAYFFERVAHKKEFMTFQSFNGKVTINLPPDSQMLVGDIMYEAFNHFRVNLWRYAFVFLTTAVIISSLVYAAVKLRQADPVEVTFQKIMFLVKQTPSGLSDLYKYYKSRGLDMTNEMYILSKEIVQVAATNKEDPDTIIGIIHHESDFSKYAKSNIRVHDSRGRLIRVDHAYGYMQVYGQAWADVFAYSEDETKPECLYNPSYNLSCGVYIFQWAKRRAGNNLLRALIFYNGGRAKPAEDGFVLLQTESYRYIEDVMQSITILKTSFLGKTNDQKI